MEGMELGEISAGDQADEYLSEQGAQSSTVGNSLLIQILSVESFVYHQDKKTHVYRGVSGKAASNLY